MLVSRRNASPFAAIRLLIGQNSAASSIRQDLICGGDNPLCRSKFDTPTLHFGTAGAAALQIVAPALRSSIQELLRALTGIEARTSHVCTRGSYQPIVCQYRMPPKLRTEQGDAKLP